MSIRFTAPSPLKTDPVCPSELRNNVNHSIVSLKRRRKQKERSSLSAVPEHKWNLQKELQRHEYLGEVNGKSIYVCRHLYDTNLLREIGRLREEHFRRQGFGSNKKRFLDHYDPHYEHLVIWDPKNLNIVAGCRVARPEAVVVPFGKYGLHTANHFDYQAHMAPIFHQGLEISLCFVQDSKHWADLSSSLLLKLENRSFVRFLFTEITFEKRYNDKERNAIVLFLQTYFSPNKNLAYAKKRFRTGIKAASFYENFSGRNYQQDLGLLENYLAKNNHQLPVEISQLNELFYKQGIQFIDFYQQDNDYVSALCIVDTFYLQRKYTRKANSHIAASFRGEIA